MTAHAHQDWTQIKRFVVDQALGLGFDACGVSDIDLGADGERLNAWLEQGLHGEMGYMAVHGSKRWRPGELVPGALRVISVRMNYWPEAVDARDVLGDRKQAYVSRYALGRDYHKVLRSRLQKLADALIARIGPFGYRAFVDSAPVLEKPLARNAGLGWIGKHTNLISSKAGSYFFLGELYTDVPLPIDVADNDHCGTCSRCLSACPTAAFPAPYQIDARRCISYLTIELRGAIPEALRAPMGNRIYGCDDCQLVCPWNKFAKLAGEPDFRVRHGLDSVSLIGLFAWSETEFLRNTEGSAIRRIGYERWLRNIAVALGNAMPDAEVQAALLARIDDPSDLVREHVRWALTQGTTPRVRFPSALGSAAG